MTSFESAISPGEPSHGGFLDDLTKFASEHRAQHWSGTFAEFLQDIFPQNATRFTRTSHQYLYDMLCWYRADDILQSEYGNGNGAATTLFKGELFGIDPALERVGEGLRLVDYKTGRPIADQKGESRRRQALRDRIAHGRILQAAAYALGGAACGPRPADGRYEFLDPSVPDHARVASISSDDTELREAFESAVRVLLSAWDAGSFFPRIVEGDAEPRACQTCEVKEACVRGDSGVRLRVGRWLAADPSASEPERAMRALWSIGEDGDAS